MEKNGEIMSLFVLKDKFLDLINFESVFSKKKGQALFELLLIIVCFFLLLIFFLFFYFQRMRKSQEFHVVSSLASSEAAWFFQNENSSYKKEDTRHLKELTYEGFNSSRKFHSVDSDNQGVFREKKIVFSNPHEKSLKECHSSTEFNLLIGQEGALTLATCAPTDGLERVEEDGIYRQYKGSSSKAIFSKKHLFKSGFSLPEREKAGGDVRLTSYTASFPSNIASYRRSDTRRYTKEQLMNLAHPQLKEPFFDIIATSVQKQKALCILEASQVCAVKYSAAGPIAVGGCIAQSATQIALDFSKKTESKDCPIYNTYLKISYSTLKTTVFSVIEILQISENFQ